MTFIVFDAAMQLQKEEHESPPFSWNNISEKKKREREMRQRAARARIACFVQAAVDLLKRV
jgi:hypothetical protein